ncbi:peptidylprolyl isomerase [Chelativorans sp. AA-79]|uniref:peptidylprolyl isomerase n=1 Tax=Chelativorans sp. AA-79 TaxID=3028735 RepID=UPI0023F67B3D|nr:peptidylprolyl isomerase [Chelativorans sp. AA-79]WEX08582.1 peptidylprolyl isomerase [Chelativorans sp. AA-79]
MATILIDHRPHGAETAENLKQGSPVAVKPAARRPAVTVDGTTIPHAAIAREAQNHPAENPATAWAEAARALVVRELLLQEGRRLSLAAEPVEDGEGRRETEEQALIRALLDRELSVPEADEASCRRYFEKNRNRFRSADLFEAAHILFSADRQDEAAFAEALRSATAALDLLAAHPERFPDLARELSACSSSGNGGHLGQFTRDQVTPEFAAALDRLEPGRIAAAPVETRYGAHIIRLDRRIEGRLLPFEAVHEQIAAWLADSVWRRAAAQYISLLAGKATITGVDFGGADTPLVQ